MRKSWLLCVAVLVLLLGPVVGRAQFRVVGYLPAFRGADVTPTQLTQLTHVNYAFVLPTAQGGLQPMRDPDKLRRLVAAAHAAPVKVKVLISVGGWNDGDASAFEAIGADAGLTRTFAANLLALATQYQLDGIDIDWEHPNATTAAGYAALMHQLATVLHPRGLLLTSAVAGPAWAGAGVPNSVFADVDFLNLMAYDGKPPAHSTYADARQALTYWEGRGLPAGKTVLGLPFYGRPSEESFAALLARGADPTADMFDSVGYNGLATIKSKTRLALDQAGGVMIWEVTQDATGPNSLLKAIQEVVRQAPASAPK